MAEKRWADPKARERHSDALKKHWDNFTDAQRSARMKAVRRKGLARKLIDAADAAVAEGINAEIGSK